MGTYPLLLRVVHPVDLVPGVEDGLQLGLRLGLDLDHLRLRLDHPRLDLDYLVANDHASVAHFLQRTHRVVPVHIGSDNHGPIYPVIGSRHRCPPCSLSRHGASYLSERQPFAIETATAIISLAAASRFGVGS